MRVLRVILVILAFVLLIGLIVALVFGNTNRQNNQQSTNQQNTTESISTVAASNATVGFLTDGVINGNESHRQINIVVSKTVRTLTIYQGYQGSVLSTKSFANNQQAFEQFLAAIKSAGFFTKRANATDASVEGQCPLGYRYIYSSTNISNVPNNLWKTSCGTKTGTFGGNSNIINQLFQDQIPDYSKLVSGVSLTQ